MLLAEIYFSAKDHKGCKAADELQFPVADPQVFVRFPHLLLGNSDQGKHLKLLANRINGKFNISSQLLPLNVVLAGRLLLFSDILVEDVTFRYT